MSWQTLMHQPRKFIRLILENKWLKLLSLILALLLFNFSKQPASSIRIGGVPVEFVGIPAGMEIVNIDSPVVNLQLKGPRNLLTSLSGNEITVPVDLSNKEQGERVAHLQIRDVKLPDRIEVLNISPASLRLRLERTLSQATPIRPRTEGSLPDGLEIYEVAINPDRILIEGPEREIRRTEYLSTETVDLSGREATFTLLVDVEVPSPLRVVGSEQVNLTVRLGEKRVRKVISAVPVLFEGGAVASRSASSKRVTVELWGPRSLVDEIKVSDIGATITVDQSSRRDRPASEPRIILPERYRDTVIARPVSAVRGRGR